MTKRKPPEEHKKPGRPDHVPTDKTRGQVTTGVASNLLQEEIAAELGIDEKTLAKHYRKELDHTKPILLTRATNKLVEAMERGEAWAVCFYLKTQGKNRGWSERHEHTGADGAPLLQPSEMSDEQLDAWIKRLEDRKLSGGPKGRKSRKAKGRR